MSQKFDWEEVSVAIDGVAGAGKTTVGRALSQEIGLTFFDTGSTYRAVALRALQLGIVEDDAETITKLASRAEIGIEGGRIRIDGVDVTDLIRTAEVSSFTSKIAVIPALRSVMVAWQRRYAEAQGGVVGDGRDCGTVVLKAARLKVYLDADPSVRALRRKDLSLATLIERDHRDSTRSVDPLRRVEGSVVIDTSETTVTDTVALLVRLYQEANSRT